MCYMPAHVHIKVHGVMVTLRHPFFGHNSAIVESILKETQETIIYRLGKRNQSFYQTLFSDFDFLGWFWREMGVVAAQTKQFAYWVDNLSQLLSQKHAFKLFKSGMYLHLLSINKYYQYETIINPHIRGFPNISP